MKLSRPDLLKNKSYINGEWVEGKDGQFVVTNPATGEVISNIEDLSADQITQGIENARSALKEWSALKTKDRAHILHRWYNLIIRHADDLAQIITAECGKPLAESKGEVLYGASFIEWFAEEGKRAYGETIPHTIDGTRILTIKQPIGVCAAITPWNFPSAMITRKVAPALAAGCTVVCKPAGETPLSALALAVLAEEAGIPAGVLNIITSSDAKTTGEILCDSPIVRKLSFTGSTRVGKMLMRQSADTMKKLSLELGGNAPFIVFGDADIDAAVEGAVACKYRNAGQTCVCANRLYIHDSVYDEFADKLKKKVEALKVANGAEDGSQIGPLITQSAIEKTQEHIQDAVDKGANIITGGNPHNAGELFFEPTILTNVTQDMKCTTEETFGPVAPLIRFETEEDVVALANATQYGLAGYFYARDIGRIWRVSEALEFGMVAVNAPVLSTEVAPFGGIKESGVGREGSKYGLEEYLELKYILMAGL